tara:strand:+ start:1559 stop:2152 length:594 start_codon:yes stop_codon:yes gene_type:complete
MANEKTPKVEEAVKKEAAKAAPKTEPAKVKETKEESVKTEPVKPAAKTESEKPKTEPVKKIPKKDEAVAHGEGLAASKKHCMYICSFIKGKTVDQALLELDQVIKMKRAIPFKGEIPHRKGNMMSGRYPVKASKIFVALLKGLKGNIIVNGLDPDKAQISIASASWASRPMRSGGRQAKRTNVILRARESKKKESKK